MKRNLIHGILCLLTIGITACTDEPLYDYGETGEGESIVNAAVEFEPLTAALDSKSTRAAGNALKSIEHLCVLLYDAEEKLVRKYALEDYTLTDEDRDGSTTEQTTKRAAFKLTIPYGRYYIYAVANMGDLGPYGDTINTVDGLKHISLHWNSDNVAANKQMFGHFNTDNNTSGAAPLLTINKKSMSLHAWIRRAASKVTVAYDGSRLEEGVFIYIRSVQIRDIPSSCLLGDTNTITVKDQLIEEGETITYGTEGAVLDDSWAARITKGRPYYPYDENTGLLSQGAHSETADALYFFENMQGEGKDKRQHKDYLGENAVNKDGKSYGSYIEVQGYYRSINPERVGNGPITYRFMLGKNVTTDYNAERNCHYKLTLRFNRFANDADWHIEYEEENPEIVVPAPYYISYLYNHDMTLPLKINAGGYELVSLEAKIDSNAWAPHNALLKGLKYQQELDPEVSPGAPLNPWNGFLSLRKTQKTVIEGDGSDNATRNKDYYEKENRGTRTYYKDGNLFDPNNTADGTFTMTQNDGTYVFNLPMYTRAKQLVTPTGYTGNNPYVAYQRKAVVRFTAVLRNTSTHEMRTIEKNATIMQAHRIVNPKGIWRKHNSIKPFRVVLKRLPYESATSFQSFSSEGAWRAYVIRGDRSLIDLGADTVRGSTGTPIDFTVRFNGTCTEKESRCAIIRVDYHNFSCQHLIFVRQGSAPMALIDNGKKWHACNMRTRTQEADCPAEEGSLFKFGNWDQPIDATNNVNDWPVGTEITPSSFKDHATTRFKIAGTEEMKSWSEITHRTAGESFDDPTINGKTVSVAAYADFKALYDHPDIEQGYGVIYGDDATETRSEIDEVYGHRYDRHGNGDAAGKGYGMRGVFVYNKSEVSPYGGRNLFFPIGTSGYGRRQRFRNGLTAALKYANTAANIIDQRPLFYDLYMRPGAIYWLKKQDDAVGVIGWDFNYFTFDFNMIQTGNVLKEDSDACFVRCVED